MPIPSRFNKSIYIGKRVDSLPDLVRMINNRNDFFDRWWLGIARQRVTKNSNHLLNAILQNKMIVKKGRDSEMDLHIHFPSHTGDKKKMAGVVVFGVINWCVETLD